MKRGDGRADKYEVNKRLHCCPGYVNSFAMRPQLCLMTDRPVVFMSRRRLGGSWGGGYSMDATITRGSIARRGSIATRNRERRKNDMKVRSCAGKEDMITRHRASFFKQLYK